MSITASSLQVHRKKRLVLDIPQFHLDQRPTLLLGVNGAGKSTLLSTLCGHISPSQGSVNHAGSTVYVPQYFQPIIGFTCEEYCTYVAWLQGQTRKQARQDSSYWLHFTQLSELKDQRCDKLSGGQSARLAIATALNSGSNNLLFDEPSASLDPVSKNELTQLYALIQKEGKHLLVSTHDVGDLDNPFERIILLHQGKIHFDGSIKEFENIATAHDKTAASYLAHAFLSRKKQ